MREEKQGYYRFYTECGAGWNKLISKTVRKLREMDPGVKFMQIKEKFGGLRMYIGSGTTEMHELCNKAEDESLITCEICGEPGKERGGHWIRTLCDACEEERNASKHS